MVNYVIIQQGWKPDHAKQFFINPPPLHPTVKCLSIKRCRPCGWGAMGGAPRPPLPRSRMTRHCGCGICGWQRRVCDSLAKNDALCLAVRSPHVPGWRLLRLRALSRHGTVPRWSGPNGFAAFGVAQHGCVMHTIRCAAFSFLFSFPLFIKKGADWPSALL